VECIQGGQKLSNKLDEVIWTIGGSEIGGTRFLKGRRTASVSQEKTFALDSVALPSALEELSPTTVTV
jgi:hypothetical protein